MACSKEQKHFHTLSKETDYLRSILKSLKPATYRQNCDLEEIVREQEKTLNTLHGDFAVKVTDLEQRLVQNTLRVFGMKEEPGEDTEEVLLRYFQGKLKTGLTSSDIDRCHRSGPMLECKPRPIVVTFTSYEARKRVLKKKEVVKDGCYIVEELCPERQKVRHHAIEIFGKERVTIVGGVLQVQLPDGSVEKFSTLWEIQKFQERIQNAESPEIQNVEERTQNPESPEILNLQKLKL